MQTIKYFGILVIVCFLFAKCVNKENVTVIRDHPKISDSDSSLKQMLKTFALPYSELMEFDSSSLVYYRSSSYDTSFLLQIKSQNNSIKGVFYEILPEYHRFPTDYADKSSKLIFFEGYSFIIDSLTWDSVTTLAKIFLQKKENQSKKGKYTDGATYALYYGGESIHGNSNNADPFEKFYSFLRTQFLDKYLQLRKPIMHKNK